MTDTTKTKSGKSRAYEIKALKARRPDIKDPAAYIDQTAKIIAERRAAKAERLKKK